MNKKLLILVGLVTAILIISKLTQSNQTIYPSNSLYPSPTITRLPPTVVFDPTQNISFADQQEIITKFINPYVDYFAENLKDGEIVSIDVRRSKDVDPERFPYSARVIFKDIGPAEFLIIRDANGFEWWSPTCQVCTFSKEYRLKYPEVVRLSP